VTLALPDAGELASPAIGDASTELRIRGLSKAFPGTLALDAVDLDVRAGEIHALCGGNGSGKSTLIKILSGALRGDQGGSIECAGTEAEPHRMTRAIADQMSIRVVHQDLGVFPDMTVAENLSLGRGFETGFGGRIRWRQLRRRAQALLERFEIPARPETPLRMLTRASQTQVAIARALQDQAEGPRGVLILDEPTAALPAHEVELLLGFLRRFAADGQAILYVSHRIDEILDLSDRVSILRDGKQIGTWPTDQLDERQLIELIVARRVERAFPAMPSRPPGAGSLLEVKDLWAGPLRGVDLEVAEGEVVGIAGLLGSGRSELLRAIYGDLATDRGEIRLQGEPLGGGIQGAIERGVAMVPEHRIEDAALPDLPLYTNLSVSVFDRYFRRFWLADGRMRRDSAELIGEYGIKASSERDLFESLSGGNQQKVVVTQWLRRKPKLLLLDEPTQGVDVGARAEIYGTIREAVEGGAGALIVASDFEELAHVVHRVVVLSAGRVVAQAEELDAHRIAELSYMEREG
jgi:ribose transport system ATP-binding protein